MALVVPAVRCLANSNNKVDILFFWYNKKKADIKLTHPLSQNPIFDLFSSYTIADMEVLKPIIRENAALSTWYLIMVKNPFSKPSVKQPLLLVRSHIMKQTHQ